MLWLQFALGQSLDSVDIIMAKYLYNLADGEIDECVAPLKISKV